MFQAEKRAHHNALERKRRDHIKDSFTSLRDSVPALQGEKVVCKVTYFELSFHPNIAYSHYYFHKSSPGLPGVWCYTKLFGILPLCLV